MFPHPKFDVADSAIFCRTSCISCELNKTSNGFLNAFSSNRQVIVSFCSFIFCSKIHICLSQILSNFFNQRCSGLFYSTCCVDLCVSASSARVHIPAYICHFSRPIVIFAKGRSINSRAQFLPISCFPINFLYACNRLVVLACACMHPHSIAWRRLFTIWHINLSHQLNVPPEF